VKRKLYFVRETPLSNRSFSKTSFTNNNVFHRVRFICNRFTKEKKSVFVYFVYWCEYRNTTGQYSGEIAENGRSNGNNL